jgi:hypothetical protein
MQQQMEAELVRRASENRIDSYYPDDGPLRRELYPKHLEFFRAGIEHRERCFLAANRVGKTEGVGGYEMVCHLTGEYPEWWDGRTFDHPIEAWLLVIHRRLFATSFKPNCLDRLAPLEPD